MTVRDHRRAIAAAFVAVAFLVWASGPSVFAAELERNAELANFVSGLAAFDAGNYEEALEIWEVLAGQGHIEAQLAVAQIYEDGLGVDRDLARARRLYERAALAGDGLGALNFGEYLFHGIGGPQDAVGAYVWMKRAAALGRKWAAMRNGEIFDSLSAEEREDARRRLESFD